MLLDRTTALTSLASQLKLNVAEAVVAPSAFDKFRQSIGYTEEEMLEALQTQAELGAYFKTVCGKVVATGAVSQLMGEMAQACK